MYLLLLWIFNIPCILHAFQHNCFSSLPFLLKCNYTRKVKPRNSNSWNKYAHNLFLKLSETDGGLASENISLFSGNWGQLRSCRRSLRHVNIVYMLAPYCLVILVNVILRCLYFTNRNRWLRYDGRQTGNFSRSSHTQNTMPPPPHASCQGI
jgi:hypothetical protein